MTPLERNILIFVVVFAAAALTFAGFGGLAPGEGPGRPLMGAGVIFCLLMLLVPWMFAGTIDRPRWVRPLIAAAHGALAGLCQGLYFFPGSSVSEVLGQIAAGMGLGLVAWLRAGFIRSRFWNRS